MEPFILWVPRIQIIVCLSYTLKTSHNFFFGLQLILGNVCIVVEARAGAKGCVFLVRADSAVINNTRNASVSTVNLSLSTL